MASDQPLQDAENEKKTEAQQVEQGKQPLNLLPFMYNCKMYLL